MRCFLARTDDAGNGYTFTAGGKTFLVSTGLASITASATQELEARGVRIVGVYVSTS